MSRLTMRVQRKTENMLRNEEGAGSLAGALLSCLKPVLRPFAVNERTIRATVKLGQELLSAQRPEESPAASVGSEASQHGLEGPEPVGRPHPTYR